MDMGDPMRGNASSARTACRATETARSGIGRPSMAPSSLVIFMRGMHVEEAYSTFSASCGWWAKQHKQVLLCWCGSPAPAVAWFVYQPCQSMLEKTLCPLIHKPPTHPDPCGNMCNRYSIGQEQKNPALSRTSRRDRR